MAELKKYLDQAGLSALVAQVKAEDVKVKEAANAYADGLAKNYDAAGSAATAEANAKGYVDQVAATLETKGEAAKVQGNLDTEVQARKDADATLQSNIDGVDAKAIKNAEDIAAINNTTTGILAQAKADATEKANAVQAEVDALEEYVGTIPEGATATDIVGYVQERTSGIATESALSELQAGLTQAQTDIDNIEKDYLKAVDKTELEGKITAAQNAADAAQGEVDALEQTHATDKAALEGAIALKADQSALEEVSGVANAAATKVALEEEVNRAKGEEGRIEGLVTAEAERAAGVEEGLQNQINLIMNNPDTKDVIDSIAEFTAYVEEHGTIAEGMRTDINKNKDDIAAHVALDHDFAGADAALKSELEGKINAKADSSVVEGIDGRMVTAEGKITTLEGKMTTVEGAVATKAEQSALNQEIADREAADTALDNRLKEVEAQLGDGDGSVADQIEEAKQAAITAATEAAAADAKAKADQALVDAKKYADDEDAKIESRVDALEAIDHDHSNKDELDLIVSGDKAKWDEAYAKRHEHANKAELDKVADGDVAKWNAAEQNAKDYADGLNSAMTSKVDGIDGRLTTVEGAVAHIRRRPGR